MLVHSKFCLKDASGMTLRCGRKVVLHVPLFSMNYTELMALEVNLLLQVVFLVPAQFGYW